MLLLAESGISRADAITIIVLCVVIAVFLILDIILVFSLHKRNKKLAEPQAKSAEAENVDAEAQISVAEQSTEEERN